MPAQSRRRRNRLVELFNQALLTPVTVLNSRKTNPGVYKEQLWLMGKLPISLKLVPHGSDGVLADERRRFPSRGDD
jgi:hypothetical protein